MVAPKNAKTLIDVTVLPAYTIIVGVLLSFFIGCQPQEKTKTDQDAPLKNVMIDNAQYARCAFLHREIKELRIIKERLGQKAKQCTVPNSLKESWEHFQSTFSELDLLIENSLQELQTNTNGNSEIYLVLQNADDLPKSELYWNQTITLENGKVDKRYALFKYLFTQCDSTIRKLSQKWNNHLTMMAYWEILEPKDDPNITEQPNEFKFSSWESLQFFQADLADSQEWLLQRQWKSLLIQKEVLENFLKFEGIRCD